MNTWRNWLSQRTPREQNGIQLAVGLLLMLVIWQWAVGPAWQVLRNSEAQRARLAQQTTQMQYMQQQLQQLRHQSPPNTAQAAQSLQTLSASLGPQTKFNRQGQRVTLDFKAVPAKALAELLTQARSQAQAQVQQAHWQHTATGWEGQLVFALPATP